MNNKGIKINEKIDKRFLKNLYEGTSHINIITPDGNESFLDLRIVKFGKIGFKLRLDIINCNYTLNSDGIKNMFHHLGMIMGNIETKSITELLKVSGNSIICGGYIGDEQDILQTIFFILEDKDNLVNLSKRYEK